MNRAASRIGRMHSRRRLRKLGQVAATSALLVFLPGCTSEGERAEERYAIVARSGDIDARCEAAREVERAWLEERNAKKYDEWNVKAGITCQSARLRALLR